MIHFGDAGAAVFLGYRGRGARRGLDRTAFELSDFRLELLDKGTQKIDIVRDHPLFHLLDAIFNVARTVSVFDGIDRLREVILGWRAASNHKSLRRPAQGILQKAR